MDARTSSGHQTGQTQPVVLDDPDAIAWDDCADVVVVGFGGAGAAAAIQARQLGAEVIALDRFSGGGATAYSGGIIYAGGGTSVQQEAGVADSVTSMRDYLALEVGNVVSSATLDRYCAESPETIDWLRALGVEYRGTPFHEKAGYPPEDYYLYYSGNEALAPYKQVAPPALRGHRPVGLGMGGTYLFDALRQAAERLGVRLRQHAPVTRLIVDRGGAVLGVEALRLDDAQQRAHEKAYAKVIPMRPFMNGVIERQRRRSLAIESRAPGVLRIRARRGVVLSTGGFINNLDMLRRHAPFHGENYRAMLRMGSLGCDGSGIELAQSVGATTRLLDQTMMSRNLAPPSAFLEGILVNPQGRRFINEGAYAGHLGRAVEQQSGGEAWLVLSAASMHRAIREIFTSGWLLFKFSGPSLLNILFGGTKRARSAEKLARKCGMESAALDETIRAYDQAAAAGTPDPFGKSASMLHPLGPGPYYAVNCKIANRFGFNMLFTLGGIAVQEDSGLAIRSDGRAIPGLYAAGRAAVGVCSNFYVSGLSIGDAVFSGRRAARHAMAAAAAGDVGRATVSSIQHEV